MKIRFRCEIPVYKKLSFTDSGYTIKRISKELLESLRKQELETGDLVFKKMQIRKST